MCMNRVTLIGFTGQDAKASTTQSGREVTRFTPTSHDLRRVGGAATNRPLCSALFRDPLNRSKYEPDLSDYCPRLQKVRSAKRRQEVVKGDFVRKVFYLYGCRIPLVSFRLVEQIVSADTQVEDTSRLHAIGIVVVVLQAPKGSIAALWKRNQLRRDFADCAVRVSAVRDGVGYRHKHSIAGQTHGYLLIRCEA